MTALMFHVLVLAALTVGIVWVTRWTFHRSPWCGVVIATGVGIRLLLGALLFAISWWQLPLFRSLQAERGFWVVAQDAPNYFRLANLVSEQGIHAISWDYGSPTYVVILSVWMRLVGSTPAAGFLLNVLVYVAVCGFLVAQFGGRGPAGRACLFTVGSITLSPVLLFHGTQPLKDELFVALIVVSLAGISILLSALVPVNASSSRSNVSVAWLITGACILVMAGIRVYYALALWGTLGFAIVVGAALQPVRRLPEYVVKSCVVLATLWVPYSMADGADFYREVLGAGSWTVSSVVQLPSRVVSNASAKRAEFIETGGGTSLTHADDAPPPAALDSASAPSPIAAAQAPSLTSNAKKVIKGVAALVVPMTLLRAAGVFQMSGGRGLIGLADLDTVYTDISIVFSLWFLMTQSEATRRDWPMVLAVLALSCVIGGLLAYVVTNFGTLFRLRLLATAPLWVLPVLCCRPSALIPTNSRSV